MKLNEKLNVAQQHLDSLEDQGADKFNFEWEGIHFSAASIHNHIGNQVELKARLGRLYYTIEDPDSRGMALERLFMTNRSIDGKYSISNNGDIHFESSTLTQGHLTGNKLMSALTVILLESEQHLRTIRAHLKSVP